MTRGTNSQASLLAATIKKMALAVLFTLFLSLPSKAQSTKVRITTGEWPPFTSQSLLHHGFAAHVTKEAFAVSGISVTWGFMPWARAMSLAEHTQSHASIPWLHSPEREQKFYYSEPILIEKRIFYVRTSDNLQWESLTDFHGKTIGAYANAPHPLLREKFKTEDLRLLEFPNHLFAFRALLNGRIDAVVIGSDAARFILQNNFTAAERSKMKPVPEIVGHVEYHLLISRQLENGADLMNKFNAGLQKLRANGRYKTMLTDFNNGVYEAPQD